MEVASALHCNALPLKSALTTGCSHKVAIIIIGRDIAFGDEMATIKLSKTLLSLSVSRYFPRDEAKIYDIVTLRTANKIRMLSKDKDFGVNELPRDEIIKHGRNILLLNRERFLRDSTGKYGWSFG